MRAAASLLVAALPFVAGACAKPEGRYPVVIAALTDDGKPFAGLAVTIGRVPAGRTGADGRLALHVRGKEGTKVPVSVEVPKGYRVVSEASALVLRRLTDIEGGHGRVLPVEHVIKLAPLARHYAVLVRVGVPGLPVITFGTQQAVTNAKGVAMFLYEGAPGDELHVKVSKAEHPELRPQNPSTTFLLGQRAEAYVFKEKFAVPKAAPVKHRKPVHVGPVKL
jgi:hypothetical protein